MADPGDFLCSLLELLGLSIEAWDERAQAIILLSFLLVFGVIAGCLCDGLTARCWWGVAGISAVLLLVALFRRS